MTDGLRLVVFLGTPPRALDKLIFSTGSTLPDEPQPSRGMSALIEPKTVVWIPRHSASGVEVGMVTQRRSALPAGSSTPVVTGRHVHGFDRNGRVNTCQLKRCDARMQDGGISVIDSGKATLDRRIKLNRINYFLAVAAEGGRNFGEAPVLTLPP